MLYKPLNAALDGYMGGHMNADEREIAVTVVYLHGLSAALTS